MKSLVNDDLFVMTRVAAEIYNDEQSKLGDKVKGRAWEAFYSTLLRLEASRDRSLVVGLRPALDAVGADLHDAVTNQASEPASPSRGGSA